MYCVYKIKFTKSPFDLNEDYDRLSDIDKEKIADMNADSFFDYEEDGVYTFFTIAEPIEVKRYLGVLSENLVRFELTDLSKDVLKGNFDIDSEVGDKVELLDSVKFSFFVDDLNDWIYNNLDIDTILDRINIVGIDSLTKVEKEFLNNNYNV
jgi:hypothetical protein